MLKLAAFSETELIAIRSQEMSATMLIASESVKISFPNPSLMAFEKDLGDFQLLHAVAGLCLSKDQ